MSEKQGYSFSGSRYSLELLLAKTLILTVSSSSLRFKELLEVKINQIQSKNEDDST